MHAVVLWVTQQRRKFHRGRSFLPGSQDQDNQVVGLRDYRVAVHKVLFFYPARSGVGYWGAQQGRCLYRQSIESSISRPVFICFEARWWQRSYTHIDVGKNHVCCTSLGVVCIVYNRICFTPGSCMHLMFFCCMRSHACAMRCTFFFRPPAVSCCHILYSIPVEQATDLANPTESVGFGVLWVRA